MKHAVKLREWKMVPFYVNMMGWKHGPNIEVYYRAPVFYFVEETAERMCVVTVTKNFRKNEKKK
jgi:hypothetical protein